MITAKEILQIDATVIAGILILIGIIVDNPNEFRDAVSENENIFERFNVDNPKDWAYFGGATFGVSAVLAAIVSVYKVDDVKSWI